MADLVKVGNVVNQIASLLGELNEEDLAVVKRMIMAIFDPDKINMISPVYAAQVPIQDGPELLATFTAAYAAPIQWK
jgi:hypothetical protein